MPIQYGGENGCLDELEKSTFQQYLDHRDFFIEDVKYRNNEDLRVGKQPDYESSFGIEGSFRKIDVDQSFTKQIMTEGSLYGLELKKEEHE